MDIWSTLERWLAKNLGIEVSASQTEAWKEATADVLRNGLHILLERAVAEAFAKIYCMDVGDIQKLLVNPSSFKVPEKLNAFAWIDGKAYAGTDRGLYVWRGQYRDQVPKVRGRVTSIAGVEGKVYAGTNEGLYVKDGRRWVRVRKVGPGVAHVLQTAEKSYVFSISGIYVWEARSWRKLCKNPWIWAVAEDDGNVFIGTAEGLYVKRRESKRWSRVSKIPDGVRFITKAAGQIYVITFGDVLFVLNKGRWGKVLGNCVTIAEAGGRVYVGTTKGLYARYGEQYIKVPEVLGLVYCVAESDGKIFAGTDEGLYFQAKQGWKPLRNVGSVYEIFAAGKKGVFLKTSAGLWLLRPEIKDLPSDWQNYLLDDVGRLIEKIRSEQERSAKPEPSGADSQGVIRDEKGLRLFSD